LKQKGGHKGDGLDLSRLSKAMTVYSQGGVPIVNQLDSMDEVSRKAMEGGFLVAITQFSNMKLADENETATITFESRENGTFIVTRTPHYIGSLLWREDIGVPIEPSKAAILDLLKHLEVSCNAEDLESVQRCVQQYTSNLP
jgi:hypothetical protein